MTMFSTKLKIEEFSLGDNELILKLYIIQWVYNNYYWILFLSPATLQSQFTKAVQYSKFFILSYLFATNIIRPRLLLLCLNVYWLLSVYNHCTLDNNYYEHYRE